MKKLFFLTVATIFSLAVFAQEPVNLNDASFKTLVFDYDNNSQWNYAGDLPCIVDFYADWCAPCRNIAPSLQEIAQQYSGQLVVYKVNVDKARATASAFNIRSIPTLLFIPANGDYETVVGGISKSDIESYVKNVLKIQ